jgi:hypothetical protein
MPIESYHGQTFVSFIDISGFKAMMKNREKARDALSTFFQTGYSVLKERQDVELHKKIDGLFVSDCGVLFSRYNGENQDSNIQMEESLSSMLSTIEKISKSLLKNELMLTASIAYGQFDFDERVEFRGIDKNMMFGYAYLNAYLDNEVGKPKLNPGQCRILTENLDKPFLQSIINSENSPFNKVEKNASGKKHLYYYWMLDNPQNISDFKEKYKDTYNLKYRGMLEVLKDFAINQGGNS